MDDMDEARGDAIILPSCIKLRLSSSSSSSSVEPKEKSEIKISSKSTAVCATELNKEKVVEPTHVMRRIITPSSTNDSSNVVNVVKKNSNQIIEVESTIVDNKETRETQPPKLEDSSSSSSASNLTNSAVPAPAAPAPAAAIGVPLARSSPISREFLALQRSLNESKILTEFVSDTAAAKAARKGRKSQFAANSFNQHQRDSPLNRTSNRIRSDSLDIAHIERRYSSAKRSNMRSHNSEFAQKHMDFLNRVIQQQQSGDEQYGSDVEDAGGDSAAAAGGGGNGGNANADDDADERHTITSNSSSTSVDLALQDLSSLEARLKGIWQIPPKRGWDGICWRCRDCAEIAILIPCSKCLRCFHKHCIKVSSATKLDNSWNCPECLAVENALSSPKKSRRPEMSLDMLSQLLSFALKRMRSSKGNTKFIFADTDLSIFSKYIVNPVTFASLEEKIAKKAYKCPEEFYNDTKWMIHNAYILTTGLPNNKLVVMAKSIVKVCRQEANEIETCPSCYLSANSRSDWFVDVCAQPHLLLWAKLKGFPYWPAKAMGMGQNNVVNVRFFGKHDRAFVPIKDCYLFSEQDPNAQTGKRSARDLADCIKEVEVHIKNIETKIGKFNYAPFKMPYDPNEEQKQIELMMPGVQQYMKRLQAAIVLKPSLQYKIVKTADNHLSIIKKANDTAAGGSISGTSISSNDAVEASENVVRCKEAGNSSSSKACTNTMSCESSSSKHTSKYEVITKTNSNDTSNCPKVNAVILKKRKSTNFINITNANPNKNGDENSAAKLSGHSSSSSSSSPSDAKIVKKIAIESQLSQSKPVVGMEVDAKATSVAQHASKRKQLDVAAEMSLSSSMNADNDEASEKPKTKHSRTEPRLPIITIKTSSSAKIVETTAREVAENFAKSNTCVTIKKISLPLSEENERAAAPDSPKKDKKNSAKDPLELTPAPPSSSMLQTSINGNPSTKDMSSTSLSSPPSTKNSQAANKSDKEISETERNIFRELVPFVEIKQEVVSDEETEEDTVETADPLIAESNTLQLQTAIPNTQEQNEATTTTIEPMLVRVKEEALSDDEERSSAAAAAVAIDETSGHKETSISDVPMKDLSSSSTTQVAAHSANNLTDNTIRVVGGTTIQRVSLKNTSLPTAVTSTGTTIYVSSSPSSATVSSATQSRRNANRTGGGIPFGPLPASATSATSAPKIPIVAIAKTAALTENANQSSQQQIAQQSMQQQQQQQLQTQRARKSFPNRSPPRLAATCASSFPTTNTIQGNGLGHAGIVPSSISAAAATESKRVGVGVLKSASMVSIPADIAAQRNINQNSVPMPPLTAVSKTAPIILSMTNSIAANNNNSPASSPPNTAIVGTIAPSTAFANTATAAAGAGINKNTTTNIVQQNPTAAAATLIASNQTQINSGQQQQISGISYTVATALPPVPVVPPQLPAPIQLPVTTNIPLPNANNALMPSTNNRSTDANSCNATENHLLGDLVTPALANAITEVICRGPPKMARRPNGPLQSDGSTMFPSEAGPVCRKLVQNAHKLTDFFISVMEDTMCDMSNSDEPSLQAKITLLTMELERMKQSHEKEIAELKRTSDLMLCEMRKSMENEKTRIANEIRKQCEFERLRCVEEAKRKQWCANCGREAQFYCCWNTSYCDYPCQQQHWARHAATCAQTRTSDAASSTMTSSLTQPAMIPSTSASTHNSAHIYNNDGRNKTSTINTASMNINIQYNKNVSTTKKDKQNNAPPLSSTITATNNKNTVNVASSITNDPIKLPSNTYIRQVAPNNAVANNNCSPRSSGFNPPPPPPPTTTSTTTASTSRYNITLPMKSPANTSTPYTIVQRGNSWELLTTSSNTAPINTINNVNALQSSSLTSINNAHHAQAAQQQQQQRSATMSIANVNNKTAARNRGIIYASNGNVRATKM